MRRTNPKKLTAAARRKNWEIALSRLPRRKPTAAAMRKNWEIVLPGLALDAMEDHKDGVAAAMVYCIKLDMEFPDWLNDRLVERQVESFFSASRPPRQKQLHCAVSSCEKPEKKAVQLPETYNRVNRHRAIARTGKGSTKFDYAAQMLEGTGFGVNTSEMRKSYYAFRHIFGSRFLSLYVANSIIAADTAYRALAAKIPLT
jgi:hypothetical protein